MIVVLIGPTLFSEADGYTHQSSSSSSQHFFCPGSNHTFLFAQSLFVQPLFVQIFDHGVTYASTSDLSIIIYNIGIAGVAV